MPAFYSRTTYLICLTLLGTVSARSAERPNLLLICVDDLRPELNCFGAEYIHSPNIDRLAQKGSRFTRHYVQAPTCGASRFTLLTGRYGGAGNEAIFQRAHKLQQSPTSVPASFPAYLREHGYQTVSVGKVSHHPGGRGGPDWDDDSQPEMPNSWDRHLLPAGPWQHPRGAMHGLANGEIRSNAKSMDVFQSTAGKDEIYPDGLIVNEALEQLAGLSSNKEQPFFLALGLIRPHLPFGAPAAYMEPYRDAILPSTPHPTKPKGRTTWHNSGEFMKYNRWGKDPNQDSEFANQVRKHYAACVSYADAQVGRVLARLEELGLTQNTIIILWGDHGWHLGEHAIWGKHALFEESLRSPLIICVPQPSTAGQSPTAGQLRSEIVETLDIFPTVCELLQLPIPEFAQGSSLVPLLNGEPKNETIEPNAISYTSKAATIRTSSHRLILHNDGFAELYEHSTDPESDTGETENIAASHPDVVAHLTALLKSRRL